MWPLKESAHLRIPLQEVRLATQNFNVKHLIDSGGYGHVYKGQVLHHRQLIDVDIKRFDRMFGLEEKKFLTEISMLSSLKHLNNIVSIVGFCAEAYEKIIVTEVEVNGSLNDNLKNLNLTWLQRLHICIGVARALTYIHCDTSHGYYVIHRDVKSSNVMLDGKWDAKLSGFGLSIKVPATRRHDLVFDEPVGTMGYVDPVYVKTGIVTPKTDVYSFGVVLFEVLSGRRAYAKDGAGRYLASVATSHYEEGKLDEIIDPHIRNQMHPQSFKIFSDTAYDCLKKDREQRPDMEKVAKRLENAWELQWKHENPAKLQPPAFGTSPNHVKQPLMDDENEGTSSNRLKIIPYMSSLEELAHLRIPLQEIISATQNFAVNRRIVDQGGFGYVYKGKLSRHGQLIDVDIKRLNQMFGQGKKEFWTEIALLSSLKHTNVVSIVGFCDEANEKIIVTKLEVNGSLENNLTNPNLTWLQRLHICIGAARASTYIHCDTSRGYDVIHRDVKSSKVLLDENWDAKVSGFGLSVKVPATRRHDLVIDHPAGTIGYADPSSRGDEHML
uniref:receptor-like protein kinase FERONIA n=1 Tax=Erigeron canadensis TaxID=72917 RepID=UPI001CB98992|nr:receptor-like protein kinase FERONIA [Erigeron canadensis]